MAKNRRPKAVRVIPLGGVGEIGKNMMVIEYEREMIVVDAGLMFPDDEMLGIDLVIPDISYLIENRQNLRGILLTHGHEDHIGALPYVLRQVSAPVYGTKLTLGLLQAKFEELPPGRDVDLRRIKAGDKVQLGPFRVEFLRVSHSIADVVALAIETPLGYIIHTGDFKLDQTPIDGMVTDFHKFGEYGERGVLLLISDSTNAERPGYTMSERVVGQAFDEVFRTAPRRIIVASFASNIHRIQQIVDAAVKYRRKVCITGRSMVNMATIARELGYLHIPDGVLIDLEEVDRYPLEKVVIITTGSQGEPMSALTRMAASEHGKLSIIPGDTVVISASPIPGNERLVGRVINSLFKQGAQVIYEAFSGVHVSGHASQEELKLMLNLTRPRYFIPVHGEYRHLVKHSQLAKAVGIPEENIFLLENGDVVEITAGGARVAGKVTAGQVLVDGLGVGDVGNIVLRDRRLLSQDGILIVVMTINKQTGEAVAGPDIISRGFVYVREAEGLMEEARSRVKEALARAQEERATEWATIKANVRESLSQFLYEKTKRRPMILPIIMEV
ncbi:MAG: ribonuclease J [Bacillota bacterium]|nr:ribonuclease J [Bacillota bacterium]